MPPLRVASFAPPAALAATGFAVAYFRVDRAAAEPTLALALSAVAVLAVLAASGRADRIVAGAALAVAAALAFLPASYPLPTAAVAAVLTASVGATLASRARRRAAWSPWAVGSLVLAVELVAGADRLLAGPWLPGLVELVVVSAAVTWALAWRMRAAPAAALALGLGAAAAGPGFGWTGGLAVVLGALAGERLERAGRPALAAAATVGAAALPLTVSGPLWLAATIAAAVATTLAPRPALARAAAALLATAALAALAAGTLPWCRARPLEAALGAALGRPFAVVDTPVAATAVPLTARDPAVTRRLAARRSALHAVEVFSYLTNAAELPCGAVAARVELLDGDRTTAVLELAAGRETADWAAYRQDVVASAECAAPPAAWSWLPSRGRFLGATYRARFELPVATSADRVRLIRDPSLPPDVAAALFWVGVER